MNEQNLEDLYNDDDEAMEVFLHHNKSQNTK
jgi:hypothetical protein